MTSLRFRFIFSQAFYKLSLCLIGVYFLYAFIDYSMHMQDFAGMETFSYAKLGVYYALQLSKRLDFLLPLSLLIASIRLLTAMNDRNELLAYRVSGITLHSLLAPLFVLASICTCINFINFEYVLPIARNKIDLFEEQYLYPNLQANQKQEEISANTLLDNSRLIYPTENAKETYFQDIYWIESFDSIWHAKELDTSKTTPLGSFVDHFRRDSTGALVKVASFESHPFSQMPYHGGFVQTRSINAENKKISELFSLLIQKKYSVKKDRLEIETHLYYKLVMPFLSFLVLLAIIPYCTRFSRYSRPFFIYAIGLFCYISFFTIMDACVIIGINHLITPLLAISLLPIMLFIYFGYRYLRSHA